MFSSVSPSASIQTAIRPLAVFCSSGCASSLVSSPCFPMTGSFLPSSCSGTLLLSSCFFSASCLPFSFFSSGFFSHTAFTVISLVTLENDLSHPLKVYPFLVGFAGASAAFPLTTFSDFRVLPLPSVNVTVYLTGSGVFLTQ